MNIEPEGYYTFLKVTYEGRAEPGERRLGREVTYKSVRCARPGDLVVSNINAVNRATCVIPEGREHLLISSEYTVLRLRDSAQADPFYMWCVLRSAAVVAELLSSSSGAGRHRVDWPMLERQMVPTLPFSDQTTIGDRFRKVLEHETAIQHEREAAEAAIAVLGLDGDIAKDRLARAKPPK